MSYNESVTTKKEEAKMLPIVDNINFLDKEVLRLSEVINSLKERIEEILSPPSLSKEKEVAIMSPVTSRPSFANTIQGFTTRVAENRGRIEEMLNRLEL